MTDADQPSSSLAGIPEPGDVLVGKYRVERVLGIGGMGAVLAATHLQLEEKVAIKFLHAESALNPESVARFLREGKAVIKIRSEHAVKVHDVGKLENGAPYLVMEHLDGDDLSTLLQNSGPMQTTDAVDFVLQACEAIAEAHSIGIVHRDLKPANLFLTRRADGSPCVKVLDFGISKATKATTSADIGMTKTQTVMGSPRYMSPEQMRSTRTVDARTDVWSIGIILYELLSGQPPFNGESMTELCAQILQDPATPLPLVVPVVPVELDAVVQRCLAKEPDQRFVSLAELGMALAPFGTASALASAERVVRVMHVRNGTLVSAPWSSKPPGSLAASVPPVALPSIGTDPTAVSASSLSSSSVKSPFAVTGVRSGKTVGRRLVAVVSILFVGGVIVSAAAFFLRGRAGASGGVSTAAISAAPVPTPPTPSVAPPTATAAPPATSTPIAALPSPTAPPATSTPAAAAISPSKPPTSSAPRRHTTPPVAPPPAPTSTAGMFDGRK